MYPTITAIIKDICKWDKHLQFLGCTSHSGHDECFSVKNHIPAECKLQCLHVQVMKYARRKRRFVSKGNIRHLLWQVMKKVANWQDASPIYQKGVLQFPVNNPEDAIREKPELDLFGYMHTNGITFTRKSVIGITKLEEIDEDCWRVSFTVDTARLGRVQEGRDPVYDEKEWKKRLRITLEAIWEMFGKYPKVQIFIAGLVRVPVPVFSVLECNASEKEIEEVCRNGWLERPNENYVFIAKESRDRSNGFEKWCEEVIDILAQKWLKQIITCTANEMHKEKQA